MGSRPKRRDGSDRIGSSGLSERHRAAVSSAVRSVAPEWRVELCGWTQNDHALAVMPEDADDGDGPTFIIHWSEDRLMLDQMQWDEYRGLGEYRSLAAVIADLRGHIVALSSIGPGAHTRH